MDITFNNIYSAASEVFGDYRINLKDCGWCDPWTMGLVCLKAIEYKDNPNKQIIFPVNNEVLSYLKRMYLDEFLQKLTYGSFLQPFKEKGINEKEDLNVHEIMHCQFRDDFEGRLSSKIRIMFRNFGMNQDDEGRATAIVGELGNNVFDHNDGQWPTDIRGAIILGQHNPTKRQIEVTIADPGIGFGGSLKSKTDSDLEAIKLGLSGVTGRTGEKRGNGLKITQLWTINKFDGIVKIHSGNGLVVVNKDGQDSKTVFPILGTLASFVVRYK